MSQVKLFILLLSLSLIPMASSIGNPAIQARITPAPEHMDLDRTITNLLSVYHYRRSKPDDKQSSIILDTYLEALDFSRSFLLASDIRRFEKYRNQLDNYLLSGNLDPAYEIFNVYLQRLAERTKKIEQQLQQPFDFSLDETMALDRENQPWASSQAELDEIWRKRLKHEKLLLILAGKDKDSARDTLIQRYKGRLRRTMQYQSQDVFQLYINAVAASYDPHTAYFSPHATENFNIQMRLSLEGIGTVLRMEEEQITVVELVPGGPAAMSGQLHPDDKIVGVGEGPEGPMTDVVGWRLDDVVDRIRGQRGTTVRLNVMPANAGPDAGIKVVRLVRDTIQLEQQAAKGEVKTLSGPDGKQRRLGVVTIPTFYSDFAAAQRGDKNYRSTTRDVRRILEDLTRQNIDGVLIDLRQNGGGSLQEAIELTGLFIPEGPVVQVRNSAGGIEVESDPDPRLVYNGPLGVLVNRFSASASEIFAGAMQDYGRAIVLGSPTFGKGTVQTLVNLNRFITDAEAPLGQLKLTIAKFYRISGSSTQHRGVLPDIALPSTFEDDEIGESAQELALPWDEISPVSYRRQMPGLTTLVPQLEDQHKQRVRSDQAFQQLLRDIEEIQESRSRTTVSLQESQRRIEREQAETKRRERANQRRVARGLPPLAPDEELPDEPETSSITAQAEDSDEPDPVLDESLNILGDLVSLLHSNGNAVVMTR